MIHGVQPIRTMSVSRGQKLIKEGSPSAEIFFVLNGSLLVLKGDILIGEVQAPSFTGELGPLLARPRSTTMIARQEAAVDVYLAQDLFSKLTLQNEWGNKFINTLIHRLGMTKKRVEDYQRLTIDHYVTLLAHLMADHRVAEEGFAPADIRRLRQEYEISLSAMLTHRDVQDDHATIFRLARQNGVEEKFKSQVSTRFRSFAPLDLSPFRVPRLEAALNFREAAKSLAEQIVILTRYLADFQTMDIDRLDSEIPVIDSVLPFSSRADVLHTAARDRLKDRMGDLEKDLHAMAERPDRDNLPLSNLAKQFGLDLVYRQQLREKWKGFVA